jgi:hypothetical protein
MPLALFPWLPECPQARYGQVAATKESPVEEMWLMNVLEEAFL